MGYIVSLASSLASLQTLFSPAARGFFLQLLSDHITTCFNLSLVSSVLRLKFKLLGMAWLTYKPRLHSMLLQPSWTACRSPKHCASQPLLLPVKLLLRVSWPTLSTWLTSAYARFSPRIIKILINLANQVYPPTLYGLGSFIGVHIVSIFLTHWIIYLL